MSESILPGVKTRLLIKACNYQGVKFLLDSGHIELNSEFKLSHTRHDGRYHHWNYMYTDPKTSNVYKVVGNKPIPEMSSIMTAAELLTLLEQTH